ncbi:neurocan core protein-like [Clupea harengus]|uniref:Neurocan core protein-like n=1 Tax=Clupea harengus TaxID=7950 RepID=A0A6P8GT83_CLUHA|nr:neurocan core protein-like [Clupea harengus]XP_042566360.1 neurocan core protein-like [Clupea harengus]
MTLLLITTLLFSGLCSLSSCVPRQFHVVKEKKTWTEAQRYCKEEFTDLATIDNMREMEMLNSTINEADAADAWIGLKQGSSPKWQWSLADRDFYREDGTEFRNWNSYQPDGTNNNCTVMKGNGIWHNRRCDETKPFVCYDGRNSKHPYVLVTVVKNWADAQKYCREKHTDLASVRNETENNQIQTILGSYTEAWIGLFRDAWEWSDNSTSSFRHWDTGEPNYIESEKCTQLYLNGRWNNYNCDLPGPFICFEGTTTTTSATTMTPELTTHTSQVRRKQIVRVEFQVNSSLPLSDAEFQERLMDQIRKKLQDGGLPADAKLTWKKQPDGRIFHKKNEKKEKKERRRRRKRKSKDEF